MTHPTSLRLDVSTRRRLQDRAEQEQVPAATVALRLIDEGLRMAAHPGVVFRAGPARWLELPQPAVRSAVDYYAEFTDEIDREIERREEAATAAHQQWTRRQQLLS